MRGLGIGIVVAALLMGIATRNQETLTDEEIKERALALGMVEQKVLADISSTPVPVYKDEQGKESAVEPIVEATAEPMEKPAVGSETAVVPEPSVEPQSEVIVTPQPNSNTQTLIIRSGETSWSISQALYDLGMVESASDFDKFLCQNGYDKTIRTGTFDVPQGATYEEIAKLIAR